MINFCIGDIIEHKYKLLEEKAQGGMNSILYRAQNLKYDKNIKNSYEYVMVKIVNLKH
jgi:hypothetical protein